MATISHNGTLPLAMGLGAFDLKSVGLGQDPVEKRRDQILRGAVDLRDTRRKLPSGELKEPKFVRFHELDSGEDCDETFWEDPLKYKKRSGRNGWIDCWGLYPHTREGFPDVDGPRCFRRQFHTQGIYDDNTQDRASPEIQFVNALIKKKKQQLNKVDLGTLPRSDYTVRVNLPYVWDPKKPGLKQPRYWRRLVVSGGLSLSVFADKILTPLFGWVRNLHAHAFHDYKDGAMFGPRDCHAVDMTHLDKSGYGYIPEERYCLAHILRNIGDAMGYHYDFGDNWWLDIELEAIADPTDSTGAVHLLAGGGASLPDGELIGSMKWAHILAGLAHASRKARLDLAQCIVTALNVQDHGEPRDFHFDRFNVAATRRALREALDSPASMPQASKKFVEMLDEGDEEERREAMSDPVGMFARTGVDPRKMKRGTAVVQTPVQGGAWLEEGVSTARRDRYFNTACAKCGNPNDVKVCTRCRTRYYCSTRCQKEHWIVHRQICRAS